MYKKTCNSQERELPRPKINLLEKCENQTLGGGVLNLAVEWNNSRVVKFLLQDINAEQSKLDLNSKEYQALKKKAEKIAIKKGYPEIIKLFTDYKEVPNKTEKSNAYDELCIKAINESKGNVFSDGCNDSDIFSKMVYQNNKRRDFRISLGKDYMGGIVTLALVVAAIMQPSDAFKAVFGALAILVAIGTGLHIKNSTVPSYVEMQKDVDLKSLGE